MTGARAIEIDGTTVVFEINVVPIPVPRPFLSYRAYRAGRLKADGVLAAARKYPGSVVDQFTDAELSRLYRIAIGHERAATLGSQ